MSFFASPTRQRSKGFPPAALSQAHISDAIARSPDNGTTIDLSKQGLTELPEEGAQDLASIGVQGTSEQRMVLRLALANNHLATLPMGFAMLSQLRYLNLKHNSFSVFPDVLTLMPGLDTLDISNNKIKRLPIDPGYLVKLRVFAFSRNKITDLPKYLAKFRKLSILKADRNPLQWPPAHIMEVGEGQDSVASMKDFIRRLQSFLDGSRAKPIDLTKSYDSGFSEPDTLESHTDESFSSWSPSKVENSILDNVAASETPHARSFSVDSNFSMSSISESGPELGTPSSGFGETHNPPKLRLGMLKTFSMATSSSHSPDSYLPSPAESCFSTNAAEDQILSTAHSRGISYTGGRQSPEKRDSFSIKKSMPDLRTAKLNFTKKVTSPLPPIPPTPNFPKDEFSIPSPLSLRQDSSSSAGSVPQPLSSRTTRQQPLRPAGTTHNPSPTRPVHSVDSERNSYFNRLSTLPTSTITSTLPEPLIRLVDSARTILFTVSQVYQAFDQFTIYTADDRLPAVLRKVLDPASSDMMHLICSLDRFDALSRKVVPPPSACRNVVECCRDTVAAFGKALGVLALQLKVLANGKDVRYLRQMLLVLYGAAAEISFMWKSLGPHLETIKPLLRSKVFPGPSSTNRTNNPIVHNGNNTADFTNGSNSSPPKSASSSHSHSSDHQHGGPYYFPTPRHPNGEVPGGRIRMTRRHAGSFSSKDVEIGKTLPSYDIPPFTTRGVMHTPVMRSAAARRFAPGPMPSPSIGGKEGQDMNWDTTHSRHGSQASLQPSSSESSSSPSIPSRVPAAIAHAEFIASNQANASSSTSTSSSDQVDKEALQAVQEAVDVAPAVWDSLDEILADELETNHDVKENLITARGVTKRLGDIVRAISEGVAVDIKLMREDAHVFLKAVVQLSNIIKTYGSTHQVPTDLRNKMVKLTNSTEEFAILLHVSSYSFAAASTPLPATPRTFSPMVPLAPSLSRSRSAQAAPTLSSTAMNGSKLGVMTSALSAAARDEGPKSAQPVSQTFKLPMTSTRRIRNAVAG